MAVNAKFLADFADIKREIDQTENKLRGLGEGAARVGPAFDRMVGKAPADFDRLNTSAGNSDSVLKSLHGSVNQVDRVLAAAGLSLGPIPGALRELGGVAGKTAADLGLLATAGLGVSAAVGGWSIGRWFAEWAGTDKIIADSTAALLGWGNTAREEAGAGADLFARASSEAGREIKTLDEAIKVMNEATFIPFTERVKGAEVELKRLTETQKAEIAAAQQVGATTKEITEHFKVSEGALKLLAERTRDKEKSDREAEAAAKKHRDALAELGSAGAGWRGVLESITPEIQAQIKQYLDAGVSQGALAEAYGLTSTKIRAVATALKEEEDAAIRAGKAHEEWAQLQVKASQEAGALWGEYEALRAAQSGTATDIAMGNIDRWKRDAITKMKEVGTFNEQTYMAVEAVAKLKLEGMRVDWDALGANSKDALQQTADKAKATYEAMAADTSRFSSETIAKFWATAEAAQKVADEWDRSFSAAALVIGQKASEAADKVVAEANRMTGALSHPSTGLTVQVGNVNPFTGAGKASTDPRVWSYLEQGYSLGEAVSLAGGSPTNIGAAHGYWDQSGWHHGTRPIGHEFRRELGGPVSAGSSYMVGERGPELFTPRTSGTISPSGAGNWSPTIIVNTVAGDGPAIARLVKQALVDAARSEGRRF